MEDQTGGREGGKESETKGERGRKKRKGDTGRQRHRERLTHIVVNKKILSNKWNHSDLINKTNDRK